MPSSPLEQLPEAGLTTRHRKGTCFTPGKPSFAPISLEPAFEKYTLSTPVALLQEPGNDDSWYFLDQNGVVRKVEQQRHLGPIDTEETISIFLNATVGLATGGELGLLGMAFHPNYQKNRQVYLSYTTGSGTKIKSVISRLVSVDGGKTLDRASEQVIFSVDQPFDTHNNGTLAFGPDGYLYFGFGDGGTRHDDFKHGQNTQRPSLVRS